MLKLVDDDRKFKEKVVNEVKEDDGPNEDTVQRENRTRHKDVLGSILLTMQACFIVMATKSCDGCSELSKTLNGLSVQLEGMHILDVYKPFRAGKTTVNTSSYCSNGFHYQLPYWLMTTGAGLKSIICQGRPTEQVVDFVKLTLWRSRMWTQLRLDYLKGGVIAAQDGLARGIVKLAIGAARFGLWIERKSRRVEIVTSKDQVAVLER